VVFRPGNKSCCCSLIVTQLIVLSFPQSVRAFLASARFFSPSIVRLTPPLCPFFPPLLVSTPSCDFALFLSLFCVWRDDHPSVRWPSRVAPSAVPVFFCFFFFGEWPSILASPHFFRALNFSPSLLYSSPPPSGLPTSRPPAVCNPSSVDEFSRRCLPADRPFQRTVWGKAQSFCSPRLLYFSFFCPT